jgi:uncharacterized protein
MTVTIISLIFIGFAVGTFGTLIGAGGGVVLVPILLIMYPEQAPETITAVSLSVVFFNALSGTIAYGWQKRIDFRSGLIFSVATVPGSVLGAWLVHFTPRSVFDMIFGIILVSLAVFLLIKPTKAGDKDKEIPDGHFVRRITDANAVNHVYGYHLWFGIAISLFVGVFAGFLGIGGGIIHVPALVGLLNFPVHIATATSQFMLGIMAFSGSTVHLASSELMPQLPQIIPLAIGAVVGAQVGALVSKKIHGTLIIRLLAVALLLVGVRILLLL